MEESEEQILQKLVIPKKTENIVLPVSQVEVTIQSINFGEMMLIYKQAKEDPLEFSKWLIYKGVVKPKLNENVIMNLNPKDATELVTQIMNLSGYSTEAIDRLKKQANMTTLSEFGI